MFALIRSARSPSPWRSASFSGPCRGGDAQSAARGAPGTFVQASDWFFEELCCVEIKPMLSTILIIILILILIGALPTWGYSSGWGYGPGGLVGLILVIVIILALMGRI
jgi:hypothetical protein